MTKIILTENQIKVITEEIDKNDSVQKLIFSKPENIDFEGESDAPNGITLPKGKNIYVLTPVIDGKPIQINLVRFLAEEVPINGENWYQLHIIINEKLRRLGIAYKLYVAFIKQGYPVVSLFKNRSATFYSDMDSSNDSDNAISNLWSKIEKENSDITVEDLVDENNNIIGIKAFKN